MTILEAENQGFGHEYARKLAFLTAPDVNTALDVVWSEQENLLKMTNVYYSHYTTVPNLMSTILSGTWYLSSSMSQRMNDQQELKKFGDEKIAKYTYQVSMTKGVRESAAFWGLYGRDNPFAIKVSIPAIAVGQWLEGLERQGFDAQFKDIIYASIPLAQKQKGDKKRGCHLFWNGVTCTFGENKKVRDGLAERLKDPKCTSWFKDVEWMHENETRLCVRRPGVKGDGLSVPIDRELIEKLSFTFSPWTNEDMRRQIKVALICCLKQNQILIKKRLEGATCKFPSPGRRFHNSTVSGALNFSKEKPKRCDHERCCFGVLRKGDRDK